MTVSKLVVDRQIVHGKCTWRTLRNMEGIPPLMLIFVRDGTIFFALTTAWTLLKIIAISVVSPHRLAGFSLWVLAVNSYSAAHLILNLRAAGMKGNGDQTWDVTMSLGAVPAFHWQGSSVRA